MTLEGDWSREKGFVSASEPFGATQAELEEKQVPIRAETAHLQKPVFSRGKRVLRATTPVQRDDIYRRTNELEPLGGMVSAEMFLYLWFRSLVLFPKPVPVAVCIRLETILFKIYSSLSGGFSGNAGDGFAVLVPNIHALWYGHDSNMSTITWIKRLFYIAFQLLNIFNHRPVVENEYSDADSLWCIKFLSQNYPWPLG